MSKIEEAMKLIGPGCACEVNLGNILVLTGALKEAIEQHEAFRQEVSDAVVGAVTQLIKNGNSDCGVKANAILSRFIITKPDLLVEVLNEAFPDYNLGNNIVRLPDHAERLRAALAKRGLEIREKSNG